MPLYVDTSAVAKLVKREAESEALEAFLGGNTDRLTTSVLTTVELIRVLSRGDGEWAARAMDALAGIDTIELSPDILREAGTILPAALRTLDALHVASALSLGSECAAVITYDLRMAEGCRLAGLSVVAPA